MGVTRGEAQMRIAVRSLQASVTRNGGAPLNAKLTSERVCIYLCIVLANTVLAPLFFFGIVYV